MKFVPVYFILLAVLESSLVSGIDSNLLDITLVPDPTKYAQQYEMCTVGGTDTFAVVQYGDDGPFKAFKYGQCASLRTDDNKVVKSAVFCQAGTCHVYTKANCSGTATVVPVIVPSGVDFPNTEDFAELLGPSAACTKNSLPDIPSL